MARVVLIDDEGALRDVLTEVLTAAGHHVFGSPSGIAGLEAVRRHHPDIVLCDVNMPGMDGYAVLEAVRHDDAFAELPFLFITGQGDIDHVRAGMNLGADDYLVKPIGERDLVAAVEARLRRRQASQLQTERRLDELRGSMALLLPHELRTPLTAILGGAEMLQRFHREMPADEVAEIADTIVHSARRLHRMTENYLLYAGLQLQRLAKADAPALPAGSSDTEDVREAASERAKEHQREPDLHFDLEAATLPVAAPYLRKIVCELADNAFKFSTAGQQVTIRTRRVESEVVLEIIDGGRGMTADQIHDVNAFRQFERAYFEQQGSGLGLVLVGSIARASNGNLELISPPDEGTRARVRWSA